MLVSTLAEQLSELAFLVASGAELFTAKVALFSNNVVVSKALVLADVDIITGTGLGSKAIGTWSGAYVNPEGNAEVINDTLTFLASGFSTPIIIYGHVILTGDEETLLFIDKWDSPVTISANGQGVTVVPRLVYGQ